MEDILIKGRTAIAPAALKALPDHTIFLDTRQASVFTQGFVPGSIHIGLEGRFFEWTTSLIPMDQPLLLITEPDQLDETIERLARAGFEKISGHLEGGFAAWAKAGLPIDMIIDIEADELAMDLGHDDKMVVVDVRDENDFAAGHISGATHLPLSEMSDVLSIASLPEEANLYIHSGSGYRSVIAASLIKRQGIHNLRNIIGGWMAISQQQGLPVEKEKETPDETVPEAN